jgi:hypothetical protein
VEHMVDPSTRRSVEILLELDKRVLALRKSNAVDRGRWVSQQSAGAENGSLRVFMAFADVIRVPTSVPGNLSG